MALTYTPQADIGQACPPFSLPGVDGKTYSLQDLPPASPKVIMFICNHCPYVQAVEDRLIQLAREMGERGVSFVAISSNDPEDYPEDNFENMKKRAEAKSYPFPYLQDLTQEVAQAFGAVCTPDFFVYDGDNRLAYRGRLDDSWKDPSQVQRQELKEALEALLQGQQPSSEQIPSMGCSIKWKKTP